ncbi:MAG: T9SS type A sorting domain-containing protein [Saprospiraceae bacterium]|nr:T9SS type A sorting domain-containing protein [Saprospiraceae bacterium]
MKDIDEVPFTYHSGRPKKVWKAELLILAGGVEALSASEWEEVQSIAEYCYKIKGQAVFEAQALMRLIGVEIYSDPECQVVTPRNKSLKSGNGISVFPNPASDILNFIWSSKVEVIKIRLLNNDGKEMLLHFPSQNGDGAALNIEKFQPGLYLYHLEMKSGDTLKGKVVIIK